MSAGHSDALAAFVADQRSVSTGIRDVVSALARTDPETAHEFKRTLLEVGHATATARGPLGRSLNFEDGQMLALLATS